MAEDIVACSGCGKKFRIPEGSPPSGKFACTACGADVAWGGTATATTATGGGRNKARAKTARGRKAARDSAAAGGSTSRGVRRARGRRGREEEAADEGGGRRGHLPREKENKTLPLVIALMGIVLLIGGLIIALTGEAPDYEQQAAEAAATTPATAGGSDGGISSGDTPVTPDTPDSTAGGSGTETETTPQPLVPVQPEDDGAEEESGIGGTQTVEQRTKDYRYWFLRDESELFTEIEPVEGTTPDEEAKLRELAALATDFDAGARGMKAEGELADIGRKAIPFLLSQFQKAWNGSKWSEPNEQFACSKIQQLVREITKADGPPSDLFVRFPPGPGVEPSHYARAAKMWTAWWRGEGRYIEKFKSFEDQE